MHMKALVTGFRMPYRLSPDSKYPLSGVNTGPIENTGPKSSTRSRRFPAIGAETRDEEGEGCLCPFANPYITSLP